MLERDLTIGEVVARLPQAAEFFSGYGIDYCCGDNRPLVEMLRQMALDEEAVFAELEALAAVPCTSAEMPDFTAMPPDALCEYIVQTHHAYLRQALPQIGNLMQAVMRAHGAKHAELFRVGRLFGMLRGDLEQHILHEELVLFPALSDGRAQAAAALAPEIIGEHERAGAVLEQMRSAAHNYETPAEACQSHRQLYQMFAALEQGIHQHVHLENNILFKPYDIRGEEKQHERKD